MTEPKKPLYWVRPTHFIRLDLRPLPLIPDPSEGPQPDSTLFLIARVMGCVHHVIHQGAPLAVAFPGQKCRKTEADKAGKTDKTDKTGKTGRPDKTDAVKDAQKPSPQKHARPPFGHEVRIFGEYENLQTFLTAFGPFISLGGYGLDFAQPIQPAPEQADGVAYIRDRWWEKGQTGWQDRQARRRATRKGRERRAQASSEPPKDTKISVEPRDETLPPTYFFLKSQSSDSPQATIYVTALKTPTAAQLPVNGYGLGLSDQPVGLPVALPIETCK